MTGLMMLKIQNKLHFKIDIYFFFYYISQYEIFTVFFLYQINASFVNKLI